jgi:hypothetical protein
MEGSKVLVSHSENCSSKKSVRKIFVMKHVCWLSKGLISGRGNNFVKHFLCLEKVFYRSDEMYTLALIKPQN